VATTDFDKSQAYNSGYDVARGIDFARGIDPEHTLCIVAAGFSGTGGAGGNLALAEYLPRNRVEVVNPFGGAPPPPGGGAALSLNPWDVEEEDEGAGDLLAFGP
ncbi:MAG TPA: hypothetical protein VFB66_09940, partial [Tepidisphaeraceae bacterium]|nr:hypothetical protein [Tepidisphaeraceae bacterium]